MERWNCRKGGATVSEAQAIHSGRKVTGQTLLCAVYLVGFIIVVPARLVSRLQVLVLHSRSVDKALGIG